MSGSERATSAKPAAKHGHADPGHGHGSSYSGVPGLDYEPTDVKARPLLVATSVLLIVTALSAVIISGFMWVIGVSNAQVDQTVDTTALRVPTQAMLQGNPARDLDAIYAAQLAQLEGYKWVNKGANKVTIPIERAMQLVVERGISTPAQATAAPAPTAGSEATAVPTATP